MSDELVRRDGSLRWALRGYTPARVGLERVGTSVGTADQLRFQLDHAAARDAVHARMDAAAMVAGVRGLGLEAVALRSAVDAGAEERQVYLRRPDLGRRLDAASAEVLRGMVGGADVAFVVADGLSALAVERHALAVVRAVRDRLGESWSVGAVGVVSQGRVAVGDEVGELLRAQVVVVLIGERPGLSAADSLGAYVTWRPRVGRTDAERVCVSNIRAAGLGYDEAAERIVRTLEEARRLGVTGVGLKQLG